MLRIKRLWFLQKILQIWAVFLQNRVAPFFLAHPVYPIYTVRSTGRDTYNNMQTRNEATTSEHWDMFFFWMGSYGRILRQNHLSNWNVEWLWSREGGRVHCKDNKRSRRLAFWSAALFHCHHQTLWTFTGWAKKNGATLFFRNTAQICTIFCRNQSRLILNTKT